MSLTYFSLSVKFSSHLSLFPHLRFKGLCQVGAWGCFDEFNRLEERILSAVSQQILTIQRGLIEKQQNIVMLGDTIRLNTKVGIFVTMNPGKLTMSFNALSHSRT